MNENRFELKFISNSPGPATQEFFWIRRWPSWKTFHLTQVSFYKQNISAKGRKRIQSSIIFHFKRFSVTSIPFRLRTFVCKSRKSARNAADYSGLSQTDFQMISKLSSALKALWREAKQLRKWILQGGNKHKTRL